MRVVPRIEPRQYGEFDTVETPTTYYDRDAFIETAKGDRISRTCRLLGSKNIVVNGKSILCNDVLIRGDLAQIRIGRYCTCENGVVLRPPTKVLPKGFLYYPMQIGSHVRIGSNSVVEAACIGSNVRIGKNCIIGKRAILKDNCCILDDAVLAPDTVVPPFSVFGGVPARFLRELPPSTPDLSTASALERYGKFRAKMK